MHPGCVGVFELLQYFLDGVEADRVLEVGEVTPGQRRKCRIDQRFALVVQHENVGVEEEERRRGILELLECRCFAFGFEDVRRPVDALFDEDALHLDVIKPAADDVGLAVGRNQLADIGALPHRRELDLVLPQIEHPSGRVVSGLLADVDDALDDGLAVQVPQVEHVLPDQFRRDRVKHASPVDQVGEEICVAVEPLGPFHGELPESLFAVALHEPGSFFNQRHQCPGVAVGIEGELVAGAHHGGRAEQRRAD